ncbi:hypothetical protein [Sulfurimonas sp.]
MGHYEKAYAKHDKIVEETEKMLKRYKTLNKKERRKAYVALCEKYLDLKID